MYYHFSTPYPSDDEGAVQLMIQQNLATSYEKSAIAIAHRNCASAIAKRATARIRRWKGTARQITAMRCAADPISAMTPIDRGRSVWLFRRTRGLLLC